jgi:hypothetical protein
LSRALKCVFQVALERARLYRLQVVVCKDLKKETSYVFYGVDVKISGRFQAETIFRVHVTGLRFICMTGGLCSGSADAVS